MTGIEKVLIGGIILCFVLFAGSCAVFLNATADCAGLQGITEAVWTGKECGDV